VNEGNVELPEDSDHSVSSDEEQYPERLLAVTITVDRRRERERPGGLTCT